MNILLALSQLEVTGAEVYAVTLAEHLIAKGHRVYIVSDTLTKQTEAMYIPLDFNKRSFAWRIRNIIHLRKIIKKYDIHIIHAHSRASGWVASFAAQTCNIPLVTTVHGRQPSHTSRRWFPAFGQHIFAVCENIQANLVNELHIPKKAVEVLRNPIDVEIPVSGNIQEQKKIISIIGRLSGPKGDVAYEFLEHILQHFNGVTIRVIGGKTIPERFGTYSNRVEFVGYVDNVGEWIQNSTVVVGSGRVAVESILSGKPTVVLGEAGSLSLITKENVQEALASNFGDVAPVTPFQWDVIARDVKIALEQFNDDDNVRKIIQHEFDYRKIGNRIEYIYQSVITHYNRNEIPILMYHRLVKDAAEGGRHKIYVTAEQFERHLQYLRLHGFTPITFLDIEKVDRFDKNKKYVILTFDDGYEDNYTLLFPLLRKYNFTAVIFLVANLNYNKWDVDQTNEARLPLLSTEQINEMQEYGIEFGSHTLTHPSLIDIVEVQAKQEIFESKRILEEKLHKPVISFAYPYGKLNSQIKEFVRLAGYRYGIATDSGPLAIHEDLFQIRRMGVFPDTDNRRFGRKVKGNYTFRKHKHLASLYSSR